MAFVTVLNRYELKQLLSLAQKACLELSSYYHLETEQKNCYNSYRKSKGGTTMRILIAEDDPKLLKSLVHIFELNLYSADGVDNGIDAYTFASSGEYDGLVLDIMMPEMDGLTLLKKLRADGITTPALFLTAKTEIEQRIEGLDAGADDYLPKPFSTGELLDSVGLDEDEANRRVLKLSGGQQQRVAIARALSYNPDIILADEPTGNLDRDTQKEIMDIFRDLTNQGKCVILVSHSPDVAELCDERYELVKISGKNRKSS